MRTFRATYKGRDGQTREAKNWYIEFRDHRNARRRVPGLTDKKATAALGHRIEDLVALKVAGQTLPPDLTRWLETIPSALRMNLARIGILDRSKVTALRPLLEHLEGAADLPGFRQHLIAKGDAEQQIRQLPARVRRIIEGRGFVYWTDISAGKVMVFLDSLHRGGEGEGRRGISAQTFSFYVSAFKFFCRWMVGTGAQAKTRQST